MFGAISITVTSMSLILRLLDTVLGGLETSWVGTHGLVHLNVVGVNHGRSICVQNDGASAVGLKHLLLLTLVLVSIIHLLLVLCRRRRHLIQDVSRLHVLW